MTPSGHPPHTPPGGAGGRANLPKPGQRETRCIGCGRPMGLGYRDRTCNQCAGGGDYLERARRRAAAAKAAARARDQAALEARQQQQRGS